MRQAWRNIFGRARKVVAVDEAPPTPLSMFALLNREEQVKLWRTCPSWDKLGLGGVARIRRAQWNFPAEVFSI